LPTVIPTLHFQEKSRMHKDTPTLLENGGAGSSRNTTAGHARQPRYDPRAAGTADKAGRPRTVLVRAISAGTNDVGAACVIMLAGAGHRVVAVMDDDIVPSALGDVIAAGRVATLPGSAMDLAGTQKAIKGLAAPFRSVDAVATIMRVPGRRIALLDTDAPVSELLALADVARLLDASRAAVPGLLASERGHVIAVTLIDQHDSSIANDSYATALCAALRSELDELGIRFTRIVAGPMERKPGPAFNAGNRPRSNGVPRGLMSATDVAQALAWTLNQPEHVTVRDIEMRSAPRRQPVLSPREREVLEWTACGKTSEEISCILELSVSAVNFHLKNLVFKLQCCNKTAAVARAALLGLLT
jgi:DNA-binding CsgD family transcriptional regulator